MTKPKTTTSQQKGGAGRRPAAVALAHVGRLQDLTPDPHNANTGTERGVGMLESSLSKYGAGRSILVDKHGVIIAGNKTHERAIDLGLEDVIVVPSDGRRLVVVQRTDLDLATDHAAMELGLADNRASEVGLAWGAGVLEQLQASGASLEGLWSEQELIKLLKPGRTTGQTDPDDVPSTRSTDIAIGDLFELGSHRILCGDSTRLEEVQRVLDNAKADMVFTDPPYGVNVTGKGGDPIAGDISFTAIPLMFDVLDKVLAAKAWCYVCGGQSNMSLYSRLFERYFRQLPRVAVWDKGRTAVMRHNGYHSCYEFVYFAFKEGGGGRWFSQRDSDHADDIWRISVEDGGDERVHVTQKPVAVPARAIGNTCPPDGLVFEPFSGSASTVIACEQLGRRCGAMEIEPSYVQVAIDRWEAFTGKTAVKVGEAVR